jgi:hypothetical protein
VDLLTFQALWDIPDEKADDGEQSTSLYDRHHNPQWIDHTERSDQDSNDNGNSLNTGRDRIDLRDTPFVDSLCILPFQPECHLAVGVRG